MVLQLVQIDADQRIGIDPTLNTVLIGGGTVGSETMMDKAIREGRAFSAGTGAQIINGNRALNQTFSNPVGSGRNAYLTLRILNSNRKSGEDPLIAGFIPSPVAMVGANAVTPSNLKTGGASSMMQFEWMASEDRIDASPSIANPTGIILPTGGSEYRIATTRLVAPGESSGLFVFCSTGGSDRISISYVWIEEDI